MKKSQTSIEYLVIIGFVTFAIMSVLLVAYLYSGSAKNKINENQIEILGNKIINSAEAVFYAGEPSQSTIIINVPKNILEIKVEDDTELIIEASSFSGSQVRGFTSDVNLDFDESILPQGDDYSRLTNEGTKKLKLTAQSEKVYISMT
jgi:hypothetical protein